MLYLNLFMHSNRSLRTFSPECLLSSPSFIQTMSSLPSLPRLQFKGDKLAWGSKERSEGNHDFWQRHLWLLRAANGKSVWDFHFQMPTFHNFEHLTFPSLSFLSFLTYWIVSKKFHLTPTKLKQEFFTSLTTVERLWCNGMWSSFHLPWRVGRVGLWNDKPRSDDRCEFFSWKV